jgi:hypothetical protein
MAKTHPHLETLVVPNQGHAPLLQGRDTIQPIKRFVARVEDGASSERERPSRAAARASEGAPPGAEPAQAP